MSFTHDIENWSRETCNGLFVCYINGDKKTYAIVYPVTNRRDNLIWEYNIIINGNVIRTGNSLNECDAMFCAETLLGLVPIERCP